MEKKWGVTMSLEQPKTRQKRDFFDDACGIAQNLT